MSTVNVSDEVARQFVAEFGDDAEQVAEKALRREITRHRVEQAVKTGGDPAVVVAEALQSDPDFLAEVRRIDASADDRVGDLGERLRRSAG